MDPLGGSYFVETLTNRLEAEAGTYLTRIEEAGGAARATEYMQDEIHKAAYAFQLAVESGSRVVVGVNRYADDETPAQSHGPDYAALESSQKAALRTFKRGRDREAAERQIVVLEKAARGEANLMPLIVDGVKVGLTLGEISDAFRRAWGTHDTPR